jgi:hypothetical protein
MNSRPENDPPGSLPRMVRRHGPMVERSLTLQRMLRAAGYVKHDGVATAGISLVSRLARQHKLRDWPHTRSIKDYDSLIEVLRVHLAQCFGERSK